MMRLRAVIQSLLLVITLKIGPVRVAIATILNSTVVIKFILVGIY